MYKNISVYRQGDVSIITLSEPPQKKGKQLKDGVLARGEITGHAHRIIEGKFYLYRLAAGLLYLRVMSEFAKLYHEEHEEIVLPKGDYEIRQQREFDWSANLEVRYVAD